MSIVRPSAEGAPGWSLDVRQRFSEYYQSDGGGEQARRRAHMAHARVGAALAQPHARSLNVAQVGCGDGTGCRLWAERGHQVYGIDENPALLNLARRRAAYAGLAILFDLARPDALPWPDRSMDVCIVHEALTRAPNWPAQLRELVRVLRPGGVLYLGAIGPGGRRGAAGPSARQLQRHLASCGMQLLEPCQLAARIERRAGRRWLWRLLGAPTPLRLLGKVGARERALVALKPRAADCGPCAAGSRCCCGPTA